MGFKKASDLISISFSVTETAANTFTQSEINLDLDPISREIFVVTDIIMDNDVPSHVPATVTSVNSSVTRSTQTAVQNIGNSDTLSLVTDRIFGGAAEFDYDRTALPAVYSSTGTARDYLGVIATPNFYVQILGTNNTSAKAVSGRLTGYRAKSDADTYAALVASEVLSA